MSIKSQESPDTSTQLFHDDHMVGDQSFPDASAETLAQLRKYRSQWLASAHRLGVPAVKDVLYDSSTE